MSAAWKKNLRSYQAEGAEWLADLPPKYRARILGDPPGFGKSRTALARTRMQLGQYDNRTIPIVTTAIARGDWRREAQRYWPEAKVYVYGHDTPKTPRKRESELEWFNRRDSWHQLLSGQEQPTFLVFNYENAHRLVEASLKNDSALYDNVIVDEAHWLKYANTQTSKTLRYLIGRSRSTSLLTGTPIHNRPHDLHNLLDLCAPGSLGGKYRWAQRFFEMESGNFGSKIGKLLDGDGLRASTHDVLLQRSIEQAYGELPACVYEVKRLEAPSSVIRMSPMKARLSRESSTVGNMLRECAALKLAAAVEFVKALDEPVVVYTYGREHAARLHAMLLKAKISSTLATGDENAKKRDKTIEEWKGGATQVLVATMDAVKESATLTRASVMLFVDFDFLVGKMLQIMGRIDPARQPENERRPARYVFLCLINGPDEVVVERLVEKIQEAQAATGHNSLVAMKFGKALAAIVLPKEPESEEDVLADLIARLNTRATRLHGLIAQEDV